MSQLVLPTIPLTEAKPGDVGFVSSSDFFAHLIRFGQRAAELGLVRALLSYLPGLRRRWSARLAYCQYNHCLRLVEYIANTPGGPGDPGNWRISQATASGVRADKFLDSLEGVAIVALGAFPTIDGQAADRGRVLDRDAEQVGERYGVLTVLSIALSLLTPRWFRGFDFRDEGTLICSAHVARANEYGGITCHHNPYQVMPMQVARLACVEVSQ